MRKQSTLVLAALLALSSSIFAQTAPVRHLAGRVETGQPHLYWFGAVVFESEIAFDDGTGELFANVFDSFADNQALVSFLSLPTVPPKSHLVTEISTLVSPRNPGDTAASFTLFVKKNTGSNPPSEFLFLDTATISWNGTDPVWAKRTIALLFVDPEPAFWVGLGWLANSPTTPMLGRDRSTNGPNSYVFFSGSYSKPFDGSWMIRAKTMTNNPSSEPADSFWVYRGMDSNSVFHIVTVDSGLFDFVDTPPSSGNYYYRVTRWDNDFESAPSNAILLSASPTSVKNREKNQSAFLLSEPFPNPFSIGVLFTARTEKQMDLGFSIYNLLGQKVFSQSSQTYSAGEHRFHWRGEDAFGTKLPSGAYFLRFQAGEETIVKKLLLLR